MRRFTRSYAIAGTVLTLALLLVGWIWLQASQARQISDPSAARRNGQPIPVRTALVQEMDFNEVCGATAVTIPSQAVGVRLGPSRSMTTNAPITELLVKEVHVQEGAAVQEGGLLVSLEDEALRQVMQQREAAHAAAWAELERAEKQTPLNQRIRELDLEAAEAQYQYRTQDLSNRQFYFDSSSKLIRERVISELEFWNARSRLAQAQYAMTEATHNKRRVANSVQLGELLDRRELARAQNNFEIARIDLELARRDRERTQVCSPIAGLVAKLNLVPGSVVGVTDLVAEVIKLDPLHLRLDFPQERLDEVAVGQPAEVTLDGFKRATLTGKVVRILPRVNSNLRVLPVIVEVPNPENRIKAGLSGYVRLRTGRKGLSVPALAVQQRGGKAVVFRVEDGRARLREVNVGPVRLDGHQEVLGGLEVGAEVVIYQSNFYKNYGRVAESGGFLQDDDLVATDWRKWARRDD